MHRVGGEEDAAANARFRSRAPTWSAIQEEPRREAVEENVDQVREKGRAVAESPLEAKQERGQKPKSLCADAARPIREDKKPIVPDPAIGEGGEVERDRGERAENTEHVGARCRHAGGGRARRGRGGPRMAVLGFPLARHGGRVPIIAGRFKGAFHKEALHGRCHG